MREWLIRIASWCQPWQKCNHRGADGCNEMTFCSSFPSTSLASSPPAGKDRSVGRGVGWSGDASREMERRQDMKQDRAMNDGRWCPSTPAVAFSLPCQSLCPPWCLCGGASLVALRRRARPRCAEEALLFLMRYSLWDFKRSPSPALFTTLAQRGGKDGRIRQGK